MKRGSLIGPLILMLIGALFLLNNLKPELPVLQIIGDYWPYLLIGWGALRFVEILYWWGAGKPLPAHGVSGGEWVLVIFLCLGGSALFFGHRYTERWPQGRITMRGLEVLGESYDFPYGEQKRAVGKTPRILVENLRGNARVVGSDTEELRVVGRMTVRAFNQADAARVSKECPLELVPQGDLLVVRTNQDRASGAHRITSDLEIAVPKGAIVQARGRAGDFDISDVTGVDVDSDNAGVRLNNIAGNVRAELRRSDIVRATNVKGSVEVKGSGWDVELENVEGEAVVNGSFSGEMSFRNLAKQLRFESHTTELRAASITGQLRMGRGDLSADGIAGPVILRTESKDVELTDFTQTLEIAVNRGDIELRPGKLPLSKMDVRTRSGNIHLAVPPPARFQMRATTARGEIANEFGAPLEQERDGRGARLTGSVGAGPEIQLATDRGSVTVRKVSLEAPAPPLAPEAPEAPKAGLKVEKQ